MDKRPIRLKAYLDDSTYGNLSNLDNQDPAIQYWASFANGPDFLAFNHTFVQTDLKSAGFIPSYWQDQDIVDPGIYFVSLRNTSNWWTGHTSPIPNCLTFVHQNILQAMRERTVILVLCNQTEGEAMLGGAFHQMHDTMEFMNLPPYSIIISTGHTDSRQLYHNWCANNNIEPMLTIHHTYLDNTFPKEVIDSMPDLLVDNAIANKNSKDFMSLNYTVKQHRLEHLYFLLQNDLDKKGLISGHWHRNEPESNILKTFISRWSGDIDDLELSKVLNKKLPLIADKLTFDGSNPADTHDYNFNTDLYSNALLSFVTESEFNQQGSFITEKTYKALLSGHPVITLNGSGAVQSMRDFGFRTDWTMINNWYDDIQDHTHRFKAAHQELLRWCNLTREEQLEHLYKSRDVLKHNKDRVVELSRNDESTNFYSNYAIETYNRLRQVVEDVYMRYYT